MKRIVIPTDFSENAQNAFEQATSIFEKEYCEFYLIHAYSDDVFEKNARQNSGTFNTTKKEAQATINEKLLEFLDYAKGKSSNPLHHFTIKGIYHSLLDAIDDLVNQEECDLVVMGTKGESNNTSSVFGSNTLKVTKYVECPVLVIPNNESFKPIKNILFPTNFMKYNSCRELNLVNQIGNHFSAKVHFLYQSRSAQLSRYKYGVKSFLCAHLKSCEQEIYTVKGNDLLDSINSFIEKNEIDLITIVNTQESYLDSLLEKSTVDKLTLFSKTPLLVLQNTNR